MYSAYVQYHGTRVHVYVHVYQWYHWYVPTNGTSQWYSRIGGRSGTRVPPVGRAGEAGGGGGRKGGEEGDCSAS